MQPGINYPGSDIVGVHANNTLSCRRQCAQRPHCLAFTFIKNSRQPSRACWLKGKGFSRHKESSAGTISGIVRIDVGQEQSAELPCFESVAELRASPWALYLQGIYGGDVLRSMVQDQAFPFCASSLWTLDENRLKADGIFVPTFSCAGLRDGRVYAANVSFLKPKLGVPVRKRSLWVHHSGPLRPLKNGSLEPWRR